MKKALLFFSIFVSVLVCLSCGKEKEDNSFRMTDSWWMAKGRGGNTNYFFHFTSEEAFDFYDYGVSPLRQQTALYSTKGTMVSNSDGTVQFKFRAASIDLDGYWKDKDLSGCAWFHDLVFTSGRWNPSKPTTKDESIRATIDVSCHADYITCGIVSDTNFDFETSFKRIGKDDFEKYRGKAFE